MSIPIRRTLNPGVAEIVLANDDDAMALSMHVRSWGVMGLRAVAENGEPTANTDKAPEYPITKEIPVTALGSAMGSLLTAGIYRERTFPDGPEKDRALAETRLAIKILEFFTKNVNSQLAKSVSSPSA